MTPQHTTYITCDPSSTKIEHFLFSRPVSESLHCVRIVDFAAVKHHIVSTLHPSSGQMGPQKFASSTEIQNESQNVDEKKTARYFIYNNRQVKASIKTHA